MHVLRLALPKCRFIPTSQVTDDASILTLKNLVLEPLVRWEDGGVRPGLFAEWSHDGTARRWRFLVRAGATFHDGRRCTAEDVVAHIARICGSVDQFGMRWAYARYLADSRIAVAAPDCVTLEHPTPFADILDIFSEFFVCRDAPDGSPTLGTGPYRVVSQAADRSALLERVTPGEGLRTIAVTAMPDADDRLRGLREGVLDAATNLERAGARLPFDSALEWHRTLNTMSVMFYLNGAEGLFANPAARLAVNHAVDGAAIIRDVLHGLGQRASSVVSPLHLGMRVATPVAIPFDRDAARRLLDGCDVPGRLTIRTPTHMPEQAEAISAAVAEDLAAVGLACTIDVQPDRPAYAREVGAKHIGDMAIFDSTPHSTFRVLNDKVASGVQGLWWQGHDDAVLEPLILAANHAVGSPAREAAYGRCLARLRANPPWLYLFHPIEVAASRPGVAGLRLDSKGVLNVRG